MYYDSIAPGYDKLHKEEQIKKLKIIKKNLEIKQTDNLLDVGCGTGFSEDFFNCIWTGLEPSTEMAKNNKNVVLGKAEKLPFEENTFDIIISVTAIHNFDDIEQGLKEMKRVCKNKFAFSVLKKSKKFPEIKKLIHKHFNVEKEIEEDKDLLFIGKII